MERALAEMRKRSLCHASRAPDRLGFAVAIPDDRFAPLEQSEGERDQVPHEGGLSTARRSLRRNWEKQHVAG